MNLKVGIFGTPKSVLKTRLTNLERTINNTNLYLSKRRPELNPQGEWPVPILLNTQSKGLSKTQIKGIIACKKAELQCKLNELAQITVELAKKAKKQSL